jgi:polyphosphate kinase
MPRNFLRRVEAVAPVDAPRLRERLRSLLQTCLDDNRQAWVLDADGRYSQLVPSPEGEAQSVHARLIADSWGEERRSDGLTV